MALYGRRGIRFRKPKQLEIQIDDFKGGTNILQKSTRLDTDEAAESTNLMLVQDGLWKPRWGTSQYSADPGGSVTDGFGEFVKSDGTTELIIIANGKAWRATTSTTTEITGATFTAGTRAYMVQIGGELYIANGVDPLARYDGSTMATYTEISAPENLAAARGAGLSAGSYTYYYQVTALNEVGETVGSTEDSVTVNQLRGEWDESANEKVSLTWDAVVGATRYQIYQSTESGYEVLLDESATNSYTDNGVAVPNIYIEVPDDNTTGGPKFTQMDISNNRIWATGDPDNEYRVYFSGVGANLGNFSAFYGGGWVDLEKGGRNKPKAVVHYQDGTGRGIATAFCSTPDGNGSIWQINLETASVEGYDFIVPVTKKIVGSIGTDAPRSVVTVENDIFFFNKNGVYVLGNEPNFFGILRTNELSARIRPYIRDLDDSALEGICGYYFDAKVFFSIPTTGGANNRIIVYDRERLAWVKDWTLGVSQFGQFTDTSGITRFLGGKTDDGYLIEFSENYQGDEGVAFNTTYRSPRIPVDEDWTSFAKIKKAYVRLGDLKGSVEFTVNGTEKRAGFSAQGTETIEVNTANTGLGFDGPMGTLPLGSSEGSPETFASGSLVRYIRLNKRLRDIQFKLETSGLSDSYALLGLRAEGFPLDTSDPSGWKLGS